MRTCGFKSRLAHHLFSLTAYARVVELVDSLDSGSSVHCGRAGSSPASRTKIKDIQRMSFIFCIRGLKRAVCIKCRQKRAGGVFSGLWKTQNGHGNIDGDVYLSCLLYKTRTSIGCPRFAYAGTNGSVALAAPHFYGHISLLFLCGIHFADGLDDHAGQCEQG